MDRNKGLLRGIAAVLVCLMLVFAAPESFAAAGAAVEGLFARAETEQRMLEAEDPVYDIIGEDISKRDAFTKHYVLRDKSYVSVVSEEPVHYYANGAWQEIDPTLERREDGTLVNAAGAFEAVLGEDISGERAVTLAYGGYELSWRALGTLNGRKNAAAENYGQQKKQGKVKRSELAEKKVGAVRYQDTYANTDIEYQVAYNGLKENIIIRARQNKYEYSFIYRMGERLAMRTEESGGVAIYDRETAETVFAIPAPYMVDANGELSYDAYYTLKEQGKGQYRLTVTASADFIRSAALPVTLDPAIFIQRVTEQAAVRTSYLASGTNYASQTNLGADKKILYVGYEASAYKWCRTYIQTDLPKLTGSDIVTNAYIGLVQKQGRYNTVSAAEQAIGIAEVRRSWSPSTLTWNMQKSDSFGDFLDYQYVVRNERTSGSGTYFDIPMQWNVTAAVKRWYAQNELTACASGNSENFGFVLRMVNENLSGTSPASHAIYYNDRTVTNYAPYLVIEYRNNKGLESYWTYHGQSAGRAGVGQVNDYTGNLVFTHADASTSGSRMPVTLSHVYNSYDADVENAVIPCGRGWMLSIAQTVTPVADAGIAANYPYYYTDSDGTRHYFMKTSDNKLMDEDGLGYTLTVNTSGDVKYTVKDRSGNTMSFDEQGRLVKIADTAYNYASVAYSASAVTVTDGTGQSIVIALSGGRVSSITTPDGKAVSYQYNAAGYLVSVTYPDGKSSYYTYAAAPAQADGAQNTRPLLSAQEPGGYAVHYEYTPDRARRVSRVYETGGGQLGQGMYVAYGEDASTTFTSAGVDGVFGTNDDILTVCQFDHFGHTVAAYSRLKGSVDSVLSAQYYGFDTTDYSAYQAANNRLTSVASGNVGAANRVVQPGFESMSGVETYKEDNAIFVLNPSIKLQGQASASIFTSSETGGLALYKQTFALMHFRSSDRSYTASVYVYVPEGVTGSGGVVIGVCPANAALSESDYTVIPLSELAREQNGWSRISFTVTPQTSSDFECFHIYCGIKDLKGSACFDCLQFEQSSTPNAYSLIGLGSFDYNQNTTWTYSGLNPALGTPAASANATGSFDTVKSASQTVNISENGSFTLSGWASAPKAVPTGESAKKIKKAVYSSGKYAVSVEEEPFFGLKAVVTYTDNTTKEAACSFNTAVAGVQYASVSFDTENEGKTPKSITVTAEYAHQLGYVSFSNVQLTQGSFTAYEYNENGFLTSMKQDGNAAGNVTDAKGNVTSSTDINGQTTTYTYNAKNLLTASTLPTYVKSAYDYDSHGNLIASSVYGGNFAAYVGPSENVTYLIGNRADHRLFLDATGGGKAAIYTGKDEQLFTLEKCGDYWYIVAHNGQVLGLDGNTYPMPHVSLMDKVTEAGAQQDKQLFKVECLGGITKMYPKTQLNYQLGPNADYLIIAPMTTMNFAWELLPIAYGHPEAISTTQQYDSNGRFVASSTDERGNVTTYTYDQATGRLLSFTDSTGTTAYTYDPNTGELLSVSKGGAQVQYAYEDDRLSTITRNGFSYAFEYDAFGNNTKTKAGNTVLAENTYNTGAGLLQSTAYGNGDTASFGYDSYGRVISLSYGGTLTFSYTYDNAGRMLKSYDHRNGRTYSYHYDFKGRLAAKVCSDGTRLNYTYDNRDYLLSSAQQIGDFKLNKTYLYGDGTTNKKLKSQVYGMTAITDAGTTLFSTSSVFDRLDRLSTRTLTGGTYTQTTSYAYEWGTTLPQSVTVNGSIVSYTYDEAGNITTITDGSLITYYAYDGLNQLVREDNAYSNKTVVYTYDNGGNILSRMEYAYSPTVTDLTTLAPTNTVTYAYGNEDWCDQLTSFNGEIISYDAIGNPLSYRGMSLSWQNGRQLAALLKIGLTASYTYNDDGLRTSKTVNGVTTEYYWNGSQLLGQKTGTSLLHFLYDERGMLVGFNDGIKTYIYTRNLQGDITAITDTATGETVATYTYDSWGNVLTTTGTMAEVNPFRYRGYYYDSETELYYLQSRYYDAEVGRFLNADGVLGANGDIHTYNLYAYCGNNPIMRLDSSGYFFAEVFEFIKAVVAATESAMVEMSPMYDACGAAILVDGPLPIGDTIGAIGAAVLTTAALVIGVSEVLEGAPSIAVPKVEEKEKDITIPDIPKKQAIFPLNPYEFNPKGLKRVEHVGIGKGKNGAIFKWYIPASGMPVFEWDQDLKNGAHYHILNMGQSESHGGMHFFPGAIVPEPWNTMYFGG